MQAVKPKDFAMQINLSMENCWGIVRALVDVVAAMDDGKYLLVKCAPWKFSVEMPALVNISALCDMLSQILPPL